MLRTEGIVLNETRYRDTSKILNIYTKKLGKISVMARGAYNPKSKLIPYTQAFAYNEYDLQRGRNFFYIRDASVVDSFYNIREDIERMVYGSYILELINKSTPEEEKNEVLFLLLEKALQVLSQLEEGFLKFIIAFELKFISFLGYRPYVERCVNCGNDKFTYLKFSILKGGVICHDCFVSDNRARPIDKSMYEGILKLLYAPLDNLDEINIEHDTLRRIQNILEDYILFNIDRSGFNSLNILKTMMMN